MVRCGLGLLGYGAEVMTSASKASVQPTLQHVLRWISRIIHVQRYPAGATVGYGTTHTLERESVLGVVPVGYGDGYPLTLSNKAQVRLLDEDGAPMANCRVLGRVNMDQIVVDLTDCAEGDIQSLMERQIEVIGRDAAAPNALPTLAGQAGLHCYAMLCGLSAHLPRQYSR